MKKVEENLVLEDELVKERLLEMKRLILEQMKTTIKRKIDARGEKRSNEIEHEKAQSKPRIVSPPKTQQ